MGFNPIGVLSCNISIFVIIISKPAITWAHGSGPWAQAHGPGLGPWAGPVGPAHGPGPWAWAHVRLIEAK